MTKPKTKKKKEKLLPKCEECGKTIQLDDIPELPFSLDDEILPNVCLKCLIKQDKENGI